MTRIGVINALWKRPDLERIVMRHYAALEVPGVELVLVAVGSEGAASQRLAERAGWHYVKAPNTPLGRKRNRAAEALRSADVDGVVVIGSDNLLNAAYFESARDALRAGIDYMNLRGLWFYDLPSGRMIYGDQLSSGVGTMVSRWVLERVDFKPWDDDRRTRLDASLHNRCRPGARKLGWISDLRTTPVRALDIKTERNMWTLSEMETRFGGWTAYPEADPDAWLQKHFPHAAADLALMQTPTP